MSQHRARSHCRARVNPLSVSLHFLFHPLPLSLPPHRKSGTCSVRQKHKAINVSFSYKIDNYPRFPVFRRFTLTHTFSRHRYTGPPYVKMNGSLRLASKRFPKEWTEHLKGNNYTNTVYACSSLLRKFSQISHIPKKRCANRPCSLRLYVCVACIPCMYALSVIVFLDI